MIAISRRRLRIIRYLFSALLFIAFFDFLLCSQSNYPYDNSNPHAIDLQGTKSVFIASTQWNSGDLLANHWLPSILRVVQELKAANVTVFVSIYENGSWDATKYHLDQLRQSLGKLQVQNEIVLDDKSHEQIIAQNDSSSGWLHTIHGTEMRRIPYLASVRNKALKPIEHLSASGIKFDKLLYINDVVFSPADVMTLLGTRNGKYAAACGLDFLNPPWNHVDKKTRGFNPPGLYDDFAMRDANGGTMRSHLYPYFSSRISRDAILSSHDVPMQSCWNGLVSFNAEPFQRPRNPLRFRGIPDSLAQYHVEASESCTIHYDNPLSSKDGVWVNPRVRVGYSPEAYAAVSAHHQNGTKLDWPTKHELRWGHWKSRWLWWWLRDPGPLLKIRSRIHLWKMKFPDAIEPGLPCVADLAMVLTGNGWAMRGGDFE